MNKLDRISLREILEHLSNGPYAWPGGYPLFFVTEDGDAMSFEAVQENIELVARATISREMHHAWHGWRVEAVDINWEDGDLYCCHTGKRIPSAYAD